MKNKKLLIIIVVLLVLITSFLLFILKPNTKNKKLKELNYNVTYKEAFPDENLRRGVILCIMRNRCGEEQYNSGAYNLKTYREKHNDEDFINKYYLTKTYATDLSLGPEITDDEINTKAEEQISKTDLDKIQVFISNNLEFSHEVTGIEYLTNLKAVVLKNLMVDNVDFPYNKNLERVFLSYDNYVSYIKDVNLNQNTKLKEVAINLRPAYEKKIELDYSMLNDLETLVIDVTSEYNIKFPLGIKLLDVKNYDIKKINLSELVNLKELYLKNCDIKKINLDKNINLEKLNLDNGYNRDFLKIDSLDFSNNLNLKELDINNIDIKKINLDKNINLEKIKFSGTNLNELDLFQNINLKDVILSSNNITNIKINSEKVEKLDLSFNYYFKNINVTKFSNLKYLNLDNTMIRTDTIDFSKNPLLEEVYINYFPPLYNLHNFDITPININSLDFSNNLNLKKLKVKAKLKKLNIEKNINLNELDINYNNITDLKVPNHLNYNTYQYLDIKVQKDTNVEIPVNFNGEKLYLNPTSNFMRNGDKYRFTEKGNFEESIYSTKNGFTYNLDVNVEVVDKDENIDPSLRLIDQLNYWYRPGINEEIDVNQIRRMVTNLPVNIKNFEIVDPQPAKFKEKGKQILKVKVTFHDDTSKVYNLPINIYEKEYNPVKLDRKFNEESVHILEKEGKCIFPCGIEIFENKEFNYERTRGDNNNCGCGGSTWGEFDDNKLFARVNDEVLSYEYSGLPNGLIADQNGIHGKIDYKFKENEKEHTFYVVYKEKGLAYNIEETIKIKVLRDTDSDGIPDSGDDDVDGDGFSDVDELKAGSNPYDKNSTPNNVTNVSKNTEADKFNPIIDQKDFKPFAYEPLTKEKVKEMITNLPSDIKDFKVLTTLYNRKDSNNYKMKTTVLVTFKDNSKKEFDIPVKHYKEKLIRPTINIEETTSILEGKNLNLDVKITYDEEEKIDEANLTKFVHEKQLYYKYDNLPQGLKYTFNKISGVIDYKFIGEEEEKVFDVTYYEGLFYNQKRTKFEIKLLRDTDKDGIPDKNDDDKDGDGVNNDIEVANGSNPYNKNIVPGMTKKQILDVLVNDLEKLINDSKNNSFETKNKLDVDNFKKENLSTAIEKLKEFKKSYNDTTSDTELVKLQKQVKELIYNIKDSLNNIQDKANFEVLDKEVSDLLIKNDYYDEEAYKRYIKYKEEAKNLNIDTSTQKEVDAMVNKILNEKFFVMYYDETNNKLKEKIKELKEQLDNGQCEEEECSYIKDKILFLYNEFGDCDSIIIREMIETIEIAKDLFKKSSLKNPNTGIKTYSLVILFIILISYKLIKKKKSFVR